MLIEFLQSFLSQGKAIPAEHDFSGGVDSRIRNQSFVLVQQIADDFISAHLPCKPFGRALPVANVQYDVAQGKPIGANLAALRLTLLAHFHHL